MRLLRAITLSVSTLGLIGFAACGGSDEQAEWPDPTVVDRSADDLELPEASGDSGDSEEAADDVDEPPAPPVRVVAGEPTPIEGAAPALRIVSPRNDQVIATGSVSLRIRAQHWPLEPDPGQHIHVIVDNEPYIAVRDVSAALDLNALVQQSLGHELAEGSHVVRIFPSRSHHESVKTPGAFASVVFHYRSRTEGFSFDRSAPLLTYSRPKGCAVIGSRVLLDFYLANTEIAEGGNRVHYRIGDGIDDAIEGDITTWAPHFIENLPVRSHTIRLTLVDANGEPVAGAFNDTQRVIQVADSCE